MLVVMSSSATDSQVKRVKERIKELGFKAHDIPEQEPTAIGVTGNSKQEARVYLDGLPGVTQVLPISKPYKLASRDMHPHDSIVDV